MHSQEAYHPPSRTRITDLLNPVIPGRPPDIDLSNLQPTYASDKDEQQRSSLPSFVGISRAASPSGQGNSSQQTNEPPLTGEGEDGSQNSISPHTQYSLRAANWENSSMDGTSNHNQGLGHSASLASQARPFIDVHNPGTAFYPSTSGHTIPAVVSYESNPRALLAPYPSPQRAWIPTPPRGQIGQAAHGFVHAMPGHLQTGLRPVPATFGPHPHQSQMHPPLQYVAYNDILSPTSTPVSNLNEPMGNREDYQNSERASVRLAARGTHEHAPVRPFMAAHPLLVPIVVSFHSQGTSPTYSGPYNPPRQHHLYQQKPHPRLKKRTISAVSGEESVTADVAIDIPPPASSSTAQTTTEATEGQPKSKRSRTKPKTSSGASGNDDRLGANLAKKRDEEGVQLTTKYEASATTHPTTVDASNQNTGSYGWPLLHNGYQTFDSGVSMQLGYGVGIMPVGISLPMANMQPPLSMPVGPLQNLRKKLIQELQHARCMSNRYKTDPFPRCVSCTRRWAGDTCRFQNIRFLLRDENKSLIAVSFLEATRGENPKLVFPTQWNAELTMKHIERIMRTVAKALLPHLRDEQRHLKQTGVIRRPRETDVRATCDTCMTSLFSGTWMCRQCGREACAECYATIQGLTGDARNRQTFGSHRERFAQMNPFFLSCTRRVEHGVMSFNPVSRFGPNELDAAVNNMEKLIGEQKPPSEVNANGNQDEEKKSDAFMDDNQAGKRNEEENSEIQKTDNILTVDSLRPGSELKKDATAAVASGSRAGNEAATTSSTPLGPGRRPAEGPTSENFNDGVCILVSNPTPPFVSSASSSSHLPPTSDTSNDLPTWPVPYYTNDNLTEQLFSTLWANGIPLVVTGVLSQFKIKWTPGYFDRTYGQLSCIVLDCQKDTNRKITVGDFFAAFGKYDTRYEYLKLKDWPPSADFKITFPELYDDFMSAVPVPSYTRCDGTMNIASHFPSNTIAPDLGPKMYNAYASRDVPGSKGTTRLHMDMADAVNIMMYTEPTKDGHPGTAAWDIFRAEDSHYLRLFLKKHFKGQYQNDPIHAQTFYLDPDLRRKLYEEYNVKSYRIYQRPGEAIFIPAGCAHQVCNLSDCIKVACDFVSTENIERCEVLTQEFRNQNQSMVWKEDVLQLRSMMWFAWLSCRKQMKKVIKNSKAAVGLASSGKSKSKASVERGVTQSIEGVTAKGPVPASPSTTPTIIEEESQQQQNVTNKAEENVSVALESPIDPMTQACLGSGDNNST